jgi:hypothetical protein
VLDVILGAGAITSQPVPPLRPGRTGHCNGQISFLFYPLIIKLAIILKRGVKCAYKWLKKENT